MNIRQRIVFEQHDTWVRKRVQKARGSRGPLNKQKRLHQTTVKGQRQGKQKWRQETRKGKLLLPGKICLWQLLKKEVPTS